MFRIFVFYLVYLSLLVAPVAQAQASAAYDVFMARVTGWSASTVAFSSTGAVLSSAGTPTFAASTFSAGGTAISTAGKIAVGGSEAALVVKGAASSAAIFAGVRTFLVGATGVGLIANTAFTLVPLVADYFKTTKSRLGPLDARQTDKPFEKLVEKPGTCAPACDQWAVVNAQEWGYSRAQACQNFITYGFSSSSGATFDGVMSESGRCFVYRTLPGLSREFYDDYGLMYRTTATPANTLEWVPASMHDISPYMDAPEKIVTPEQFRALLDGGVQVQAEPKLITGPSEVTGVPTKTRVETPEKIIETTTTPKTKLDYKTRNDPTTGKPVPYVEATPSTSTVVEETDKATGVKKVVSTTTTEAPKLADPEKIIVCGLPDTPPCAIDEKDTPAPVSATEYDTKLDDWKSKHSDLRDKVSGSVDKNFFSGWSSVFVTPPIAACTGYILPRDMGTIDPCPVVDGVRTIMAYIWALTALFLAVGMVKKVV